VPPRRDIFHPGTALNILVTNCGSSSLKCRLFDASDSLLGAGSVDTLVGSGVPQLECRVGSKIRNRSLDKATGHDQAFDVLSDTMLSMISAKCSEDTLVDVVGHRIVHGGDDFREAVVIDDEVEARIEALTPLAPLHNPLGLVGIRAARQRFPEAQHIAVFDTAFHQTLPKEAFLYALPYEAYTRDGVRRYGFHGSSHRSVSERAIEWLGRDVAGTRIISCHLGAGCSTAAIRDGRSIDTSMGMTPLEGLVMSTRSGDIDPGAFAFLAERRGSDARGVERMLLHESGLLGLSGKSGDMKTLVEAADAGDDRAEVALQVFAHRVRKYIGAHLAVLNGVDAIVFTGGVGENSPALRQRILENLDGLGIVLDPEENECCTGRDGTISDNESAVAVYVMTCNEELAIAREARALLET